MAMYSRYFTKEAFLKGRLSTVELLVLTSLEQLLLTLRTVFTFYKTSYLNEKVKGTGSSPTVSTPWYPRKTAY
jgi:hypothetical protein